MEPPYTLIPGTSCFIFSLPPEWSLKSKSDVNKNDFTNTNNIRQQFKVN